ncbi:ABC transporter permease [Paenibacillus koleovorans]|uniref:ABC transporter permease n=1 Tax=Paenibacillus koleovorans TaxID=121608 RepID=UPI0013E35F58|nr:ABC transporter permease subunit [Paenibacillus koleovorans]
MNAKKYIFLYILLAPALLATLVFQYIPMPGIIIAFMDYDFFKGLHSPWVGLKHIREIFEVPSITASIWNTLKISLISLVIVFPAPIALALLLNEARNAVFRRLVQTLSFLPHFLSWISVIGIATTFYALYGPLNDLLAYFMGEEARQLFLTKQGFFVPNVIGITVWKETGWSCIIFLAAIASIDQQQYEASWIDGAGRFQQMWYITLPGILPTIMILLILRLGNIFASNFELIYGLQNSFINYDVISTIIYKSGIQQQNYSMATAVGFVEGLIALLLTLAANRLSKKVSGVGVW